MKLSKIFAVAALAALTALNSCEPKEDNLGAADISIDPGEITLSSESGASQTIDLRATRDWTVEYPDWLNVEPRSGKGSSSKRKITITARANPGIDRTDKVKFTIGFSDAVLIVNQEGEAGSATDALVYKNDFDKTDVAKVNDSWPYLDQTDCWNNESGNGIEGVKYEYKTMSVRNSGKLSNDTAGYSLYAGSGKNKLFFGKQGLFAIKNIATGGKTDFSLSFGGQRYSQDDKDNTFNHGEFKVYVSIDGLKGVEVPYSFATGTDPIGNWDLASASFAVPAGTENLTVVFKIPEVLPTNAYSIDDVQLIASAGGTALDFSSAVDLGLDASEFIPDSDEVTDLATIISQPSGTSVTILNATVTAVNTRGYVISDGTNHIYVYKGSDAKLAIGDKVSIIGTFQYYWGEYEISGPSEKKTGTATAVYPETPLDLTPAVLTEAVTKAATTEESTGFEGINGGKWFPIYAKATATVHKDGNYTQFLVEGYDGYISLVSAPSAMFQDASGTDWGEGNEVELLGYYTGWESKNHYHQFIAVSVTGEATYIPVEAEVSGDDVFIAANVAHDQKVENGSSLTSPVVVGDASISFLGGGNTGKYYNAGSAVRIYKDGYVEISTSRKIEKIEFLFAPSDNNGTYSPVEADVAKLFDSGEATLDPTGAPKLVWTGAASKLKFTYPLDKGNYRIQQIGITYGADVEARLAVSPESVSVKADETSAKFTVQSNVAWTIASDNNAFTVNPASGEGTAEVTVSFPANESLENEVVAHLTVSANGVDNAVVTVTQAKAIDESTVTDIKATCWDVANGTEVELYSVTVSEVSYKNYIVTDGKYAIYVWANSTSHGRKIGDKLNLSGKTSWYNGLLELASPKVEKVVSAGNTVPYPEPVELTGAVLNSDYAKSADNSPFYAKFTAEVTFNGNYVQFTPEGANNYISLQDLPNAVKETLTEGQKVTVYGYYGSWHSKNNFHQFYYVRHETVGEAKPTLKVDKSEVSVGAAATEATVSITSNVAWQASVSVGAELDKTSGEGNGSVKVSFAANTDTENAKTYTVTLTGEGVDAVTVTITQAKAVAQGGGGEEEGNSYYIVFANKANGVTGIDGTQNATTIIGEGTNYVTAKPFKVDSGKCYYGGSSDLEKQSVRLGKSGEAAQLTISLSDAGKVTAKSILVATKNYGGNKNVGATLNVNGIGARETSDSEIEEITYTFETPTAIDSIVLSSDKAVFVYKIKVNY